MVYDLCDNIRTWWSNYKCAFKCDAHLLIVVWKAQRIFLCAAPAQNAAGRIRKSAVVLASMICSAVATALAHGAALPGRG